MVMVFKYKFNGSLLKYLQLDKNKTYSVDCLYNVILNICKKSIMPLDLAYLLFSNSNNYNANRQLPSKYLVIDAIKKHIINKTIQGIVVLNDDSIKFIREISIII